MCIVTVTNILNTMIIIIYYATNKIVLCAEDFKRKDNGLQDMFIHSINTLVYFHFTCLQNQDIYWLATGKTT
jgi:hypothetical protein